MNDTFFEFYSDHLAKHVKTHNNLSSRNKGKMSDSLKSKSTATFDPALPEVTSTSDLLDKPDKEISAGRFDNNQANNDLMSRSNVDASESIHYSLLSPSPTPSPLSSCSDSSSHSKRSIVSPSLEMTPVKSTSPQTQVQTHSSQFSLHPFPSPYYDNNMSHNATNPEINVSTGNNDNNLQQFFPYQFHTTQANNASHKSMEQGLTSSNMPFANNFSPSYQFQHHIHAGLLGM